MTQLKKLPALALAFLLILSLALPAGAAQVPDLDRKCSVTVSMRIDDTPVPGGTLTIYRVGEVRLQDGAYSFQPTGDFAACGEALDGLHSPDLAEDLKDYAEKNSISGLETKEIGKDGTLTFSGLEAGLYLIVQHKAPEGYCCSVPFLVTLPYYESGQYLYDLTAGPKPSLDREPKPTDQTLPPETIPEDDELPQTGQLNWPVPVMAALGLGLFTLGWFLCFGKRRGYES